MPFVKDVTFTKKLRKFAKSMTALELVLESRSVCWVARVDVTLEVMVGDMVDRYANVVLVSEDTTVF